MPTEKQIDAIIPVIKEGVGIIYSGNLDFDKSYRVMARQVLEVAYQVFLDEASERMSKHIDDNIDVYKRLADR